MPAQPSPSPSPDENPPPDPVPVNRAERRGQKKDPAAAHHHGSVGRSGPAHPGAQGRKVNPIRRSG